MIIVMPAFMAESTLKKTYNSIPKALRKDVILVDDCSTDETVKISKSLGIQTIIHEENKGYGANQKTCFDNALAKSADVVVLLHPDFQYNPASVPRLIKPIMDNKADIVYGSRMYIKGLAKKGGMPSWKRFGNFLLTSFFNIMLGIKLTDAASGFIAYKSDVLKKIPYKLNDDGFCMDEQIMIQASGANFRMKEIPILTRYEKASSSISFERSIGYGVTLLSEVFLFKLNKTGLLNIKRFNF